MKPKNFPAFPANANELHYLVKNKYLDPPDISKKEVQARSKSDVLSQQVLFTPASPRSLANRLRVITLGQTSYFAINFFARLQQGLAVTPIEVTVLGFVFCTYCSSICWWNKPNDVELGHTLDMSCGMDEVLSQAGDAAKGKR